MNFRLKSWDVFSWTAMRDAETHRQHSCLHRYGQRKFAIRRSELRIKLWERIESSHNVAFRLHYRRSSKYIQFHASRNLLAERDGLQFKRYHLRFVKDS